jgi:HTH-type transcriptional regulator / antitoxin HigA
MIKAISTEEQYNEALENIEGFLKKGSQLMTEADKLELRRLSVLVEAYEQKTYPMPLQPQSILGMIQVKMFERKLKQKELALLLDISETTLSEVMNGKRKINLSLAKNLYKKLGIAPDFILEWA